MNCVRIIPTIYKVDTEHGRQMHYSNTQRGIFGIVFQVKVLSSLAHLLQKHLPNSDHVLRFILKAL